MANYADLFTEDILAILFPPSRADDFFEALFGDAEDGSYDITLRYVDDDGDAIELELALNQRPGKCLACNLTYGLPTVFSRHPVIDVPGLAEGVAGVAGRAAAAWRLGTTRELSRTLHAIPLVVELD
ncbi:MAG: pancreas/duodenum homeobox protein 1 [Pseudodesulfovibrio sp.]